MYFCGPPNIFKFIVWPNIKKDCTSLTWAVSALIIHVFLSNSQEHVDRNYRFDIKFLASILLPIMLLPPKVFYPALYY